MLNWDLEEAERENIFQDHRGVARAVAISPDNTLLVAGTERYIILRNPLDGQEIMTLAGGGVSLAFSPDGQTLVATDNSTITVWNLSDGTPLYSIPLQTTSLDYAPTGDLLAFTNGTEIILWDMLTQREIGRLAAHTDWINVIRFSPDSQLLATGSDDMTAIVWRLVR